MLRHSWKCASSAARLTNRRNLFTEHHGHLVRLSSQGVGVSNLYHKLWLMEVTNCRTLSTSNIRSDGSSDVKVAADNLPPEEKGIKWLWKGDPSIHLYHAANQHRTRISVGVLTLNSVKPLPYDKFKEAFRILKRKALNLRVCLKPHGEDLWFCEHDPGYIDFKVIDQDTDYIEAMEASIKEGFDSPDIPQWRVIVIPRSVDTPCSVPEIKEKYPYQYDYIFHPNHIFIDGMNTIMYMQFALDILNDLISGKAVDEEKQYGIYSNNDGLAEAEAKIEEMLLKDPARREQLISELPPKDETLWLKQVFAPPEGAVAATKHIKRLVDPKVLVRFQEKSKKAGVTFNSSFVALINAAVIDLMKEAGIIHDTYKISANHLVNLRRYIQKSKKLMMGAYNYPLSHTSDVSIKLKDNFWENIQGFHKDLSSKFKSGNVLEQKVVKKMVEPELSPTEYFRNPPPVKHDFGVSNMGDISAILPGTGEHVQLTDLMSLTTVHHYIHMDLHSIISYRGRSRYTLSYAKDYMTDEAANILADKIMSLMEELSK